MATRSKWINRWWWVASVVVLLTSSPADAQTAGEIVEKIRQQLNASQLELFSGSIIGSGPKKDFIGARLTGEECLKAWLGFISPEIDQENSTDTKPYSGKSYLVSFCGKTIKPRAWTWVPSIQEKRSFNLDPNKPIQSTLVTFFFPTLDRYLQAYDWKLEDTTNSLIAEATAGLPAIRLRFSHIEDTYLISEMILTFSEMPRIFRFSGYRKYPSGVYRVSNVEVELEGQKNTIQFNEWIFRPKEDSLARILEYSNLGLPVTLPEGEGNGVLAQLEPNSP